MKKFKFLSGLLFCFTQVHTDTFDYQSPHPITKIKKVVYYKHLPNGSAEEDTTNGVVEKDIIFIFAKYNYEPPLRAQDIKKKHHQMDLLQQKIRKNVFFVFLSLIIFSYLLSFMPVINYTDKSQFKDKNGKLTDPVVTFIIIMGVFFVTLFVLDFFDIAKMFIKINHLVSIIINAIRLLLTFTLYVSILKCFLIYFESKLLNVIEFNFFWTPLITMGLIWFLSIRWNWLMTWWGLPISYLILGLLNRFLLKNVFNLNDLFSIEVAYWMVTFSLGWLGLMQKGSFDKLKSSYLKSPVFFRENHLNLIAWDMTLDFMLKVTSELLRFILKIVIHNIKQNHRHPDEEDPTDLRESIRNKFSDDQNIINSL